MAPRFAMAFWGSQLFWRILDPKLHRLYSENRNPVVFLDESYELRHEASFYVLASAVVYPEELAATRKALLDFYDGQPLHAAPMFANRENATLMDAMNLAAKQHDGLDLIIQAPIASEDPNGRLARNRCLEFVVPLLHRETGASLFILDNLESLTANRQDQFLFSDLRKRREISREAREHHARPSQEPLLAIPDLLAWAYRQQITVKNPKWFEPLKSQARIHRLD